MDPLLRLLRENAGLSPAQIGQMLNLPEAEVIEKIKGFQRDGSILAYRAVLREDKLDTENVRAVIEIKVTPERGGGFDRLAERIAKYDEVSSCYLMSGAYDLLVVMEAANLRAVAAFVSEKLATLHGVLSTSTHFLLKPYKEQGILMIAAEESERLTVSP